MTEIRIPFRTSRVITLQIGSILFAAIGLSMLIYISYSAPIIIILSTLSLLISFAGPIILIKKLKGIPALIINDEGLLSGNDKVFVKWNEVHSISFETYRWKEYLVATIHDYDALIARSQGIRKSIHLLNKRLNSKRLSIMDIGTLQMERFQLEIEINRRLGR